MSCENHKKEVAGISDMKVLAEMIGDLHYETLAELFALISRKLQKDARNDERAGRFKLAWKLDDACDAAMKLHFRIKEIWQISKPFMEPKQ